MIRSEIFHHASEAIVFIMKRDGLYKMIEMNQAFTELVGYSRSELLRMNPADLCSPLYLGALRQHIGRLERLTVFHTETEITAKNRKKIRIELNMNKIVFRKQTCYLLVARDISEKIWFLEQLKRYPDLVATGLLDPEDCISSLNKVVPAPIPLEPYAHFISALFADRKEGQQVQRMIRAARKRKVEAEFEYKVAEPGRTGRSHMVKIKLRPFVNGRGFVTRMAFTVSLASRLAQEEPSVSVQLRQIMLDKRLSNEALSELSGISLGTISKLRNGKIHEPRTKTLSRLSKVLGVELKK